MMINKNPTPTILKPKHIADHSQYNDCHYKIYDDHFSRYSGVKNRYISKGDNSKECGKGYQQRNHTSKSCRSKGYAARISMNVILHPFTLLADFCDGIVGYAVQLVL